MFFYQVFTGIFTLEAVLKILAYGPIGYAKNLWNAFDFTIVLISLIELFLELTGSISGGTGLSVLRTLRLVSEKHFTALLNYYRIPVVAIVALVCHSRNYKMITIFLSWKTGVK